MEATFAGALTQAGLHPALGRGGAGLELAQAFDNRSERLKGAVRRVRDRRSYAESPGATALSLRKHSNVHNHKNQYDDISSRAISEHAGYSTHPTLRRSPRNHQLDSLPPHKCSTP